MPFQLELEALTHKSVVNKVCDLLKDRFRPYVFCTDIEFATAAGQRFAPDRLDGLIGCHIIVADFDGECSISAR
jgi:hypothetical protein